MGLSTISEQLFQYIQVQTMTSLTRFFDEFFATRYDPDEVPNIEEEDNGHFYLYTITYTNSGEFSCTVQE